MALEPEPLTAQELKDLLMEAVYSGNDADPVMVEDQDGRTYHITVVESSIPLVLRVVPT